MDFRFKTELIDGTGLPVYSNTVSANLTNTYQALGLFTIINLINKDASHKVTLQVKDVAPKKIKVRNILFVQANVGGDFDHCWTSPEGTINIIDVTAAWQDIDNRCYYLFNNTVSLKGYVEGKI